LCAVAVVRATVAAIVQRSSVVDAGADAADVGCESRWTQGVMEDGDWRSSRSARAAQVDE